MNREKSGVAVVLPAYRSSRFLGDALESLFAQSLPPDEIIVVDDGSPEDEEGVVRPYLDRVSYVRTENRGPGAARNLGVSLTHSPLVAFLDADDLWEPQKLQAQVAYLRERPGCLLVGADAWEFGEGVPLRRWSRQGGRKGAPRLDLASLIAGNGLPTLTVMLRREAFERVGGFDEDRELIAVEDYDLWLRLAELGERTGAFLGYVDEPLARYRRRGASLSGAERFLHGVSRVLDLLVRRNPGRPEILSLARRRRAGLYLDYARELQDRGSLLASFQAIQKSLALAPSDLKAWKLIGRGCLYRFHGRRNSEKS
ncbi:MAG TPA: glycosyltransferase family 2 protein [Planctomycetes bacterium]|nr:glycosyltransferase family 2 protein [Planctomycetota bacterium]